MEAKYVPFIRICQNMESGNLIRLLICVSMGGREVPRFEAAMGKNYREVRNRMIGMCGPKKLSSNRDKRALLEFIILIFKDLLCLVTATSARAEELG